MLKSIGFATAPLDWLQFHYQDDVDNYKNQYKYISVTNIWIMIYKDHKLSIVVKSVIYNLWNNPINYNSDI